MHHIPVETLIWVVLLIIGVVSSIAKKAREGSRAVSRLHQRTPGREHSVVASIMAQSPPSVEPVAPGTPPLAAMTAPPIVIRPRRAAVAVQDPLALEEPLHGRGAFRGMFGRGNLVRAVIAAEVLGPPKALQEQSIWSPRHSEPLT